MKVLWMVALGLLVTIEANAQTHFINCSSRTGNEATVIFPEGATYPFSVGDELAVFTPAGVCAGVVTWEGVPQALAVWEDDMLTEAVDGFKPGEPLAFRFFNGIEERAFTVSYRQDDPLYQADTYATNGVYVVAEVQVEAAAPAPDPAPIPEPAPDPATGLEVTYPNGGEQWVHGSTETIRWTVVPGVEKVRIHLYRGGSKVHTIATGVPNTGTYAWEVDASLAPGSDYKVRVRSAADGSIRDYSDAPFTVTDRAEVQTSSELQVTYPNGGEQWVHGSTETIRWTVVPGVEKVRIHLYRGGSKVYTIATGVPNTGTYAWEVDASLAPGSDYKVRVRSAADGSIRDYSDAPFTVTDRAEVQTSSELQVTYPNGGEQWVHGSTETIRWTVVPGVEKVRIHLYRGGSKVHTIATGVPNTGTYAWEVDASLAPGSDYKVRVRSAADGSIRDYSDAPFTVTDRAEVQTSSELQVTYPNGGEQWVHGSTETIRWTVVPGVEKVRIHLYRGGSKVHTIATGVPNTGTYAWEVDASLAPGSDYKVRVRSAADGSIRDYSDAPFTVTVAANTSVAADGEGQASLEQTALGAAVQETLPESFGLGQNFPNPFGTTTVISYDLPETRAVRLTVYNMLGQEVARLTEGVRPAGRHRVTFDASRLGTGVYVYMLEAGDFKAVRQMVVLR